MTPDERDKKFGKTLDEIESEANNALREIVHHAGNTGLLHPKYEDQIISLLVQAHEAGREEAFEYMTEVEVKQHIKQCEGKHPQQVSYSSHHDCFTQVCFVCRKVRSSYKKHTSTTKQEAK